MKEPFLPYLSLEQMYVSPVVQQEDGSYKCLSWQEMKQVAMPQTGSRLMDAVVRTLATMPCRKGVEVANHLDVNVVKLSNAVSMNCGLCLNELIVACRLRLACDLIHYTQLSTEEVANRCGLSDSTILEHLLKNKLKTTFIDYRKKFQKTASKKITVYK